MSEREFDQLLDTQLRQVPTPVGLLDSLRGIAALSDVELDCRLRDVWLPAGLAKRLRQTVADEALDEWLRDVPLPVSVLVRARRVTQRSGRSWLARWTAKLQWQDPRTSTTHHVATQRISRVQFATTFEGAPLSLQAAALAAEAGEIFRQAYDFEVFLAGVFRYRPKPRSLQDVLVAADRVSPALAERSEFRRFQAVFEQAARLVPERRPGVAKAGTRGWVGGRWREAKE